MSNNSIERAVEMMRRAAEAKSTAPAAERTPTPELAAQRIASRDDDAAAQSVKHIHDLNLRDLREKGFLTTPEDDPHNRTAEEYRLIKRPLLMNAFNKGAAPLEHGNLIMVTSALPGEGKTFNTLNLSLSMAGELDHTVLVVDSDVVKPSLTRLLGLQGRPGLIELLTDTSLDLADVIVTTNIPKLRVIPAGRTHSHSTELLASDQMRRLLKELSSRYPDRIVMFDAPPLLATTQAQVLSDLTGQIILIVEAGRTPQKAVHEAISQLNADKAIGVILNKSSGTIGADYYGGYYGAYGQT